ncbi:MAG: hypothetical protein IEMM0008_0590 [bacterium]|nr:MAG: hypothetical protein IEMM0008_0590 [bacterium]
MRLAVASTDGKLIDQHFGQAVRFLIYEVTDGESRFVEERSVERFCTDKVEHLYEKARLDNAYSVMKDCSYLLCSMIGPIPQEELEKRGIKSYVLYDLIENAIKNLINVT